MAAIPSTADLIIATDCKTPLAIIKADHGKPNVKGEAATAFVVAFAVFITTSATAAPFSINKPAIANFLFLPAITCKLLPKVCISLIRCFMILNCASFSSLAISCLLTECSFSIFSISFAFPFAAISLA
jgi:hypothetical protein